MRDSINSQLLKRASLWMLGQALPDARALRAPARVALTSVVIASAAGTLVALGVVAALVGIYMYLENTGVRPGVAVALVGTLGALAGITAYLLARRVAGNIPHQLDKLKLFTPHHQDLLGDLFNMVVGGFLEGVTDAPKTKRSQREEIEATMAELLRKLEKLESEAEEAIDEAAEEVVLELKPSKPRRRKS